MNTWVTVLACAMVMAAPADAGIQSDVSLLAFDVVLPSSVPKVAGVYQLTVGDKVTANVYIDFPGSPFDPSNPNDWPATGEKGVFGASVSVAESSSSGAVLITEVGVNTGGAAPTFPAGAAGAIAANAVSFWVADQNPDTLQPIGGIAPLNENDTRLLLGSVAFEAAQAGDSEFLARTDDAITYAGLEAPTYLVVYNGDIQFHVQEIPEPSVILPLLTMLAGLRTFRRAVHRA
jgi:hypothetical protein